VEALQVGKTTLAKMCRPDWRYFDLERGSDFIIQVPASAI